MRKYVLLTVVFICASGMPPSFSFPAMPMSRFFLVEKHEDTFWLIDNAGKEFFSVGINALTPFDSGEPSGRSYSGLRSNGGSFRKWNEEVKSRLANWSVNTIGAWSIARGKPYVLEFPLSGKYVDVFDKDFENDAKTAARDACVRYHTLFAKLDADPLFIGYFTDNELAWGWGYGWSGKENEYSLFEYYASLPSGGGKQMWVEYMARTYTNDWQRLSRVWNVSVKQRQDLLKVKKITPRDAAEREDAEHVADGFLRLVAQRYFFLTSELMHQYLPHHLNLGARFAEGVPEIVVQIAAKYVDVISLNVYTRDLDHFRDEVERVWHASGKPILITEFSFPAKVNRSGNQNEGYLHAEVQDQHDRGLYYARSAEMLSKMPFIVGYHWFQYFDEPPNGRHDGESCNFGFVDLENRVYEELAGPASLANTSAEEWHRHGASSANVFTRPCTMLRDNCGTRTVNAMGRYWM